MASQPEPLRSGVRALAMAMAGGQTERGAGHLPQLGKRHDAQHHSARTGRSPGRWTRVQRQRAIRQPDIRSTRTAGFRGGEASAGLHRCGHADTPRAACLAAWPINADRFFSAPRKRTGGPQTTPNPEIHHTTAAHAASTAAAPTREAASSREAGAGEGRVLLPSTMGRTSVCWRKNT